MDKTGDRESQRNRRFAIDHSRLVIATLCSALVIATRAYAQFEGIVESKNGTTDEMGRPREFVMTMWIKKDMVKIETKGAEVPSSTMIYRTDQRKIWMLNTEDKSYFEISQDEKPEPLIASGAATAKYSIKKTRKSKTIAGYLCEQFIMKRNHEETQLWGTKKLNHLVSAISKALGQENTTVAEGPTQEMMKIGVYPMLSLTKVDGKLIESQEVTKVETKLLDTTLFSLPAGYKKQRSVDMMQGMQQKK